ncbi:MAG: PEGA domain-containing protein, partial [Myxococcales bacterium]|nr:PEGA domain-containing protein [Myxococcales bacterium]
EPAPASARIATAPSGARVTIDGASVAGTTPVSVAALAPGRHAIRLELAGYEPLEATFDLEEGDTSRLSYDLRPATPADDSNPEPTEPTEPTVAEDTPSGPRTSRRQASRPAAAATGTATLTVISLPWSRVSIDGGPAHTTPLRGVEVGAGRHELRYWVQGEEPPRTQTVELAPDETRTVRLATQ